MGDWLEVYWLRGRVELKKAACLHPAFSGSDWHHKGHHPWSELRMDPYFLRLPVNTGALSGTLTKRPLLQTANFSIEKSSRNLGSVSTVSTSIQPLHSPHLILHVLKRPRLIESTAPVIMLIQATTNSLSHSRLSKNIDFTNLACFVSHTRESRYSGCCDSTKDQNDLEWTKCLSWHSSWITK